MRDATYQQKIRVIYRIFLLRNYVKSMFEINFDPLLLAIDEISDDTVSPSRNNGVSHVFHVS